MRAVAVQAPAHLEAGCARDPLHGGHSAVTVAAVDAGADMHHVREIDMVRQAVDPDPGDGFLPVPITRQLLYFWGFRGNVEVTGTAVRHRGDAGEPRVCDLAVTVSAVDAVDPGMQRMAERDGLGRSCFREIKGQQVQQYQYADGDGSGADRSRNNR